jgi:hypothetical protein
MSTPISSTNTNLAIMTHIEAVKQSTEIIKNAYRFIQASGVQEDVFYLCATVQDHIDTITSSPNIPRQMRSYEMALESAKEFTLIPEGATPIETADILKEMLAPPKLIRRQAGVVCATSLAPGHNSETRLQDPSELKGTNTDIDIRSIMSPPQQNEYHYLAPRKLFLDECDIGEVDDAR